ncbi:PIG-L family deacetylase [Mastigocoleus sp. MO_188.B34]|uniref:PIG-L deacetylase family protein n=1 Tax=Mastigocoleus sp. MO_188.B34 TaxID=3036635 RepID=UPI0026333428|nr:PIG-L family deacetylase [Mastigocoleus sp. MO_188.B34]MDJ0693863.1 PIG-L family deacetylase [Mastigocoleus sp. MO_188.B34]
MSKLTLKNRLQIFTGEVIRNINSKVLFLTAKFKSQRIKANNKTAIVFSPHQDDESLGCGGTIAIKRSLGVPVKVVFLTDGRYGRPDWIEPEDIIQFRQKEAETALNILGVEPSDTYFLGEPDGSLSQLSESQRYDLISRLSEILKSSRPEEVYVPHCQDGHPDHEATFDLVFAAIAHSGLETELFQYPIWVFWQNPLNSKLHRENLTNAYRVSIAAVKKQKKQAIESYKSQLRYLPYGVLASSLNSEEIFFKR